MFIQQSVYKCTCSKCGHSWITKTYDLPEACSRCKTKKWNSDMPTGLRYWLGDSPADEPVTGEIPMSDEDVVPPEEIAQVLKQSKLEAARAALVSVDIKTPGIPVNIPVLDEIWVLTPDKPQFHDDGRVYRTQKLSPDYKKVRTVRVDEDDHDNILEILKR